MTECKTWLQENYPRLYKDLYGEPMEIIEKDEEEKADGEEEVKKPKKIKKADGQIHVFKLKRGGKKILSVIKGMEYYSKDLKAMSSKFGKHFSCGCNVATDDIYGEHI